MLTPFGIAIRKLRLERQMRLLDLAERLGQSSAFVSAVETGRKVIPSDYIAKVANAMNLSVQETEELQRAADRTSKDVAVNSLSASNRELVAAFARRLDELPQDIMNRIKTIILKSISEELPFRRKRAGFLVPQISTKRLLDISDDIRNIVCSVERIDFPIMKVIEFVLPNAIDGFYLDIKTSNEMYGDEGNVEVGGMGIALRSDIYEGAWNNDGRDRFTVCHELIHYILHRKIMFARTREDNQPIYRDAEWQADCCAGALMMSRKHLHLFNSPVDASLQCKMTPQAARVMLDKYRKEGLI